MALIFENTAEKQPTPSMADNSQTLSTSVHDLMMADKQMALANPDNSRVMGIVPMHNTHLDFPALEFSKTEQTLVFGSSPDHGLQPIQQQEKPVETAEQLGDDFKKIMASHDPKAVEQFTENLTAAMEKAGTSFEFLIDQINGELPKGMGIALHDDERPGEIDDFHHYSLRYLEQVASGGNYQSPEYGACQEVGSPVGYSVVPEYMKLHITPRQVITD